MALLYSDLIRVMAVLIQSPNQRGTLLEGFVLYSDDLIGEVAVFCFCGEALLYCLMLYICCFAHVPSNSYVAISNTCKFV